MRQFSDNLPSLATIGRCLPSLPYLNEDEDAGDAEEEGEEPEYEAFARVPVHDIFEEAED